MCLQRLPLEDENPDLGWDRQNVAFDRPGVGVSFLPGEDDGGAVLGPRAGFGLTISYGLSDAFATPRGAGASWGNLARSSPAESRTRRGTGIHRAVGAYQPQLSQGPVMASVHPSTCKLTKKVEPSGEKQAPANSPEPFRFRANW